MLDIGSITSLEVGIFLCWVSLWTWVVYTIFDHIGRLREIERVADRMDERLDKMEERHLKKDDLAVVKTELAELRKQQAALIEHLLRERRER